jgi:hypothetical protein
MRRLLVLLAVAALLAGSGCSGDQEKGIYSNRDKPTVAPRPPAEPTKPAAADSGREAPPAGSQRSSGR